MIEWSVMFPQADECVSECEGETTCDNPDPIELWVARSGCGISCLNVVSPNWRSKRSEYSHVQY